MTAPGWPVNGIIVRSDTTYVSDPRVTSDALGGCFVSWVDDRRGRVYLQHVGATGEVDPGWTNGGETVGGTGAIQGLQVIVSDGSGGVYVAWWDLDAYNSLYVIRILDSGVPAPSWPTEGKALSVGAIIASGKPCLHTNPGGDLQVFWDEDRYLAPTIDPCISNGLFET
jgi:hypothetical protein